MLAVVVCDVIVYHSPRIHCGVLCCYCLAVLRFRVALLCLHYRVRLVSGPVPASAWNTRLVIEHRAVPHVVWSVRAPLVAVVTYTIM